jgi:protein-L-isoaspartate(D-aspartate) O-methyltransferase
MRTSVTGRTKSALAAIAPISALICYLGTMVPTPALAQGNPAEMAKRRREMVEAQIRSRGISDGRVLAAMGDVPRHLFVPDALRAQAYEDYPLPIGSQQTISQPYIVALMTSLLDLRGGERVLEIGTGSGYQAAVLSRIAGEVYSIEILEPLSASARHTLNGLGYSNIHLRVGDGWAGWKEAAPFDGILVTAAPEKVPQPLIDQLKVGGKLVIPVGSFFQDLLVYTKTATGLEKRNVIPVRFVPMTGEAQKPPARQ